MSMTLSEALGWKKTLIGRHAELISLRNANSAVTRTRYGTELVEAHPTYDAKALDRQVAALARDIRHCDEAIKRTNATTALVGYERNEDILGELV